jgi:hypothetical protein
MYNENAQVLSNKHLIQISSHFAFGEHSPQCRIWNIFPETRHAEEYQPKLTENNASQKEQQLTKIRITKMLNKWPEV